MRPPHRASLHASNEQHPEPDRLGIPEHPPGGRRTRHACRTRASPMPRDMAIAFARFREAERYLERFEGDLTEIQAQIWSRLQSALRGGHPPARRRQAPQDQPGAQSSPSPEGDPSTASSASAPTIASLLDSILQNDRDYLVRVIQKDFKVPPAAVDDVTQEVLWAVARSSCLYEASRGKLRTWLYRVGFYHSQNFLGHAYHRREVLRPPPYDKWCGTLEPMRNDAHPESEAIAKETRGLVWKLVEKIEVSRRAVFIAYAMKEMPMLAIAQTLGIPLSTAWSRLQEARQEFADALRQHRANEAFAAARKRR